MKRRDFVRLGGATLIAAGARGLPAAGEPAAVSPMPEAPQETGAETPEAKAGRTADFTLQIAPTLLELAPQVVISTIGYNHQVPGPLLRMREGQRVTVEVVNETDVPEYVHWHGLFVPPHVDGVAEEGTPPVAPHGDRKSVV